MIYTIIEYVLCYSVAFFTGMICGVMAVIAIRNRALNASIWRRKRDSKRIY